MTRRTWMAAKGLNAWAKVPAVAATIACLFAFALASGPEQKGPHSPFDAAFSPDGAIVVVSDHTAGAVALVDPQAGKLLRTTPLNGKPAGVAWSADGKTVYVAECDAGTVAQVEAATGKVARRFATGPRPVGLALAAKRGLLLAADSANDRLTAIDLSAGKNRGSVPVVREPFFLAVTPDESLAVVGNLLPAGDATQPTQAAAVSLVDLETLAAAGEVRLPPGSGAVRKIAVSPDGRWAYVAHTLGRFTLPTTQLERGWVNTNALSILDLGAKTLYCTVLLDLLTEGAADPWGLALAADGSTLWVSLAGVHQIARLDLAKMHQLLRSDAYLAGPANPTTQPEAPPAAPLASTQPVDPKQRAALEEARRKQEDALRRQKAAEDAALKKRQAELDRYRQSGVQNTWIEISFDPARRDLLVNDLAALHIAGIMTRTVVVGANGPRGLALSPDGKRLAVASYFTGALLLADPDTIKPAATVPLGPQGPLDAARRGEMIFHDATYAFQHWLSCATCHPDGRADGLNWDLLNDGMGNPKNARSLLQADRRSPVMSHGVRANMTVAVNAGFKFLLFRQPAEDETQPVEAFIRSMTPTPSPRLVDGKLSAAAVRGKKLFEDAGTGCASCHSGPLFTDQRIVDVGTRGELDSSGEFVTSTLIELWRTAPYLHDGSAATMKDVLTTHNKADKHGKTSHLSEQEIDDLIEYLLSL